MLLIPQSRRRRTFALLIAFFISIFATSGCGDEKLTEDEDFRKFKDQYPNLQNRETWTRHWSENSWIVALENYQDSVSEKARLKENIVASLLTTLQFQPGTHEFSQLSVLLSKEIKVGIAAFHFPNRIQEQNSISGFGFVEFPTRGVFWNTLSERGADIAPFLTQDKLALQWKTLESLKGVQWAEPNLESELYQVTPDAPAEETSESSEVYPLLNRIRALEAYRYVAENNLKQTPIVVAVLDTGVDYEHPDLKNQMYANPNEIPDNKKDDDENGYVDDVYGINATLGPWERDPEGEPYPGAADLGGPGKECPPRNEDYRSKSCGHGSHVAGIIAAQKGAKTNTMGICPVCKIMSLRVANRCKRVADSKFDVKDKKGNVTQPGYRCVKQGETGLHEVNNGIDDASQVRAMIYLLNFKQLNVHVLNFSLGQPKRSRAMAFNIRNLQKNGLIAVAAAGNDSTDHPNYPAAYGSVFSVCATSIKEERGEYAKAAFSNFGDWVDICAPGVNNFSTTPGNTEKPDSGTSQAAPVVAGAAGYLWSLNPTLPAEEVISTLKDFSNAPLLYGDPLNQHYQGKYDDGTQYFLLGTGFLDLNNAVRKLSKSGITEEYKQPQVTEGCIVSSIGQRGRLVSWNFIGSMPFLLGLFWTLIRLLKKIATHQRHQSES
jgi:subtilisin family serine protease